MVRWPIHIANSRVLCRGVLLEESIPIVDSPISTVVPHLLRSGESTSQLAIDPQANQLVEEGPGPALTTILTEFCTCRYCELGIADRGFFLLWRFFFFGWGDWVSCFVPLLPKPLAPWSVSSRAATFLTWGVSIISRIIGLSDHLPRPQSLWQSDWKAPLWSRPQ